MNFDVKNEEFELVEIFGKQALFTNGRVDLSALPKGIFCYNIRGSDDDPGKLATLEYDVFVNYAGSILTKEKINIFPKGYLDISDKINFLGNTMTLNDFCNENNSVKHKTACKNITDSNNNEEQKTFGVWAVRYDSSIFGSAEAWCKENGKIIEFDSEDAAKAYANELNDNATANVHYYVKEKESELGAVRKTESQADLSARAHDDFTLRDLAAEKLNEIPGRQLTPDGKASAPGRPAHLPENYLLNAELYKEAQTGNYNMLYGRLDNLAPEKLDLTDGQTYDEIRELAPENLSDEKSSVLDKLKVECRENNANNINPVNIERER